MVTVRLAQRADLSHVAGLCADHARYERAAPPAANLARRLADALFAAEPRLWCLVAVDDEATIHGYATLSMEFSTWRCAEYAHLDCLFVHEEHRGAGIGSMLLDAVVRHSRALGVTELQWQTPAWNTDAIRFYDRSGARGQSKVRYTLPIATP